MECKIFGVEGDKLSDLTPTMLSLTGIAIPAEMSGDVIVK